MSVGCVRDLDESQNWFVNRRTQDESQNFCLLHGGHMPRERGPRIWLGHPMVGAREGDLVLPVYSLL